MTSFISKGIDTKEELKTLKDLNEAILIELDKQFPKGDKARGRALVLHAIAQIEFEKLLEAYKLLVKENNLLRKRIEEKKDMKEFIKLLKEELWNLTESEEVWEIINKLAGDKLNGGDE